MGLGLTERFLIMISSHCYNLQAELEKQQSTSRSGLGHPSKSPHSKIVAENDRLIKDLKKEVSKNEKLQLSLSTLQLQHNKLEGEVKQLKKCAADISGEDDGQEVKMEELQAELEKKTSMLMEVKKHLKEAALRERELKDISGDPQVAITMRQRSFVERLEVICIECYTMLRLILFCSVLYQRFYYRCIYCYIHLIPMCVATVI